MFVNILLIENLINDHQNTQLFLRFCFTQTSCFEAMQFCYFVRCFAFRYSEGVWLVLLKKALEKTIGFA